MLSAKELFRLGALFWGGGVALLALHLASAGPSAQLLAATAMRDVVKGASPVDCKVGIYKANCDDIIITQPGFNHPCSQLPGNNCPALPCARCELAGAWQRCSGAKPWIATECKQFIDIKKCGLQTKDNFCRPVGNPPRCACVIGMVIPNKRCIQALTKDDEGDCVIVPP